jgi:hypothetical protein
VALRVGAAIARHTEAGLIAYTVIKQHTRADGRGRVEEALDRAIAEHAGDLQSEALLLTNGGMDALASESHDLDLWCGGSATTGQCTRH